MRAHLIDLEAIDRAVGDGKRILDLACGFGLVANYLCRKDPRRTVLGLDLDTSRIRIANAAAEDQAHFLLGDITRDLPQGFDTITFLDSLHYFDTATQRAILSSCYDVLPSGGRLVLREQVNDRSWKASWTFLNEWVMTRFKLTLTREASPRLNFIDHVHLDGMLRAIGFSQIETHSCSAWVPYTDTLYICSRRADGA